MNVTRQGQRLNSLADQPGRRGNHKLGRKSKSKSAPEPSTHPSLEDTWQDNRDRMRLNVWCVVDVKGRGGGLRSPVERERVCVSIPILSFPLQKIMNGYKRVKKCWHLGPETRSQLLVAFVGVSVLSGKRRTDVCGMAGQRRGCLESGRVCGRVWQWM